jgi:hypothetical protein
MNKSHRYSLAKFSGKVVARRAQAQPKRCANGSANDMALGCASRLYKQIVLVMTQLPEL